MNKNIEVGVFLPVGKNGWIHSVNTPYTPGTFEHVLEVTQNAENLGFDFVLSPSIWRGRKGPSEHWMVSLESLTTSAALLQATNTITVMATAHMTVFPPAIIAKMVTTLDQIGPGRVGLNLVTGASLLDLDHIGLWNDDLSHGDRYRLGDEWIGLVKRLWSEATVTHTGEFFETKEATMGPKPSVRPTLVNAGSSTRGLTFAAENCDIAFVSVSDDPSAISDARGAKELARKLNKPELRTFGLFELYPAETDEAAQAMVDHFNAGVDTVALDDVKAGYSMNKSAKDIGKGSNVVSDDEVDAVSGAAMIGSFETLARRIAHTVLEAELDGMLIIVPDYIKDLNAVATKLFPRLEAYGVSCGVGAEVLASSR